MSSCTAVCTIVLVIAYVTLHENTSMTSTSITNVNQLTNTITVYLSLITVRNIRTVIEIILNTVFIPTNSRR